MNDIDRMLAAYLDEANRRQVAYLHNAEYFYQISLLRRMLNSAQRAMAEESIPPLTRTRVLRSILYGHPEPDPPRSSSYPEWPIIAITPE